MIKTKLKKINNKIPKSRGLESFLQRRKESDKELCYTCFKKTGKEVQMEMKILDEGNTVLVCPKCQNQY